MRKARKVLSVILIAAVIIIWFFLPSSDLNFPYFYCLGFFLLLSALFIYPVQAAVARPSHYERTEKPHSVRSHKEAQEQPGDTHW